MNGQGGVRVDVECCTLPTTGVGLRQRWLCAPPCPVQVRWQAGGGAVARAQQWRVSSAPWLQADCIDRPTAQRGHHPSAVVLSAACADSSSSTLWLCMLLALPSPSSGDSVLAALCRCGLLALPCSACRKGLLTALGQHAARVAQCRLCRGAQVTLCPCTLLGCPIPPVQTERGPPPASAPSMICLAQAALCKILTLAPP